MLSRDADACYWIGRYIERAEASARMVDVHYHAMLETYSDLEALEKWKPLLQISESFQEYMSRNYAEPSDRELLHFFSFDDKNPNSIISTWRKARENARSIREQLASEIWESLNVTYLELQNWDIDRLMQQTPHTYFQIVKNGSHLFQGILNRTMLMGETRDWLDTGRFLERADQTARLLDVKYHYLLPVNQPESASKEASPLESTVLVPHPYGVGGPIDVHSWIAVLKSVSAYEMYRKVYPAGITPVNIVNFLVLNPYFPASVRHGIGRVEGCLRRISENPREEPSCQPEMILGRLRTDLTYTTAEDIITQGLHEFLQDILKRAGTLGAAITKQYLSY